MVDELMQDLEYYKVWLFENIEMKAYLASVFVLLSNVSGVPITLIYCMFGVTFADLCLGLYRAWKFKEYQQFKMNRGLFKFVMYGIFIGLMATVDLAISNALHYDLNFFAEWTVSLIILTEVSSSIDHMKAVGMPVPDFILLFAKGAKDKVLNKANDFIESKDKKNDR